MKLFKTKKFKLLMFICLVISAMFFYMTMKRTGKAIPQNAAAEQNPIARVTYTPDTFSSGRIRVKMADGTVLKGFYGPAPQSASGKTEVYKLKENTKSVGENYAKLFDTTRGASSNQYKKMRGMMRHETGLIVQCDFYIGGLGGTGVGACQTNQGAFFKLAF